MTRTKNGRTAAKVTLEDVARAAGVSATTAARVIHKNGYVSKENAERVIQAVQESGYRPNIQARALRLRRSYTLGLVLSSARDNPFFTNVSHAIRTAAMERGYSMLTVNHSHSEKTEQDGVKQFLEHSVEAVILCHGFRRESFAPIVEAGLPIIEIERRLIPSAHLLALDPRPGMHEAVQCLVDASHRSIAFLGGKSNDLLEEIEETPETARVDAFREATIGAGLELEDCPVLMGDYERDQGFMPGYRRTIALFQQEARRVTAIIAGSDLIAAGALQALHELRMRVPGDVSLIGYDDTLARFMSPPLSSIAQPYAALGETTMDLLGHVEKTDPTGSVVRELPTVLRTRASVRPFAGPS